MRALIGFGLITMESGVKMGDGSGQWSHIRGFDSAAQGGVFQQG